MPDDNPFIGRPLVVVGNINRDVKSSRLAAGEHLFRDGETPVEQVSETIGGGGANSAFAAAALGARVAFLGQVGADGLGARLERTLRRHGIEPWLVRDPQHATGTSIALAYENGCRHFLSSLPASRALRFEELDLSALSAGSHLLRADVWFSESMLYGGNKALLQEAKRRGMDVSLDLNWDPAWGHASGDEIARRKAAVRAVLPWVDLAHGNVRELTEFCDVSTLEDALQALHGWGAKSVVIHWGERGAGLSRAGEVLAEPPAPTSRHVHNTGTGDVLSVCMMLLHGVAGLGDQERLRRSNAVVGRFIEGALRLIPDLED